MNTVMKRVMLAVLMTACFTQNTYGFSGYFTSFFQSAQQKLSSLVSVVTEHPKAALGVVASVVGIFALSKYFSSRTINSVEPEVQPEEVQEEAASPSRVTFFGTGNLPKAQVHGGATQVFTNIENRLAKFKTDNNISCGELQRNFGYEFTKRSTLYDIVQHQNPNFSGVLWRHHPQFNDNDFVRYGGGYWFFYMGSGEHNYKTLRNTDLDAQHDREALVQNYKIHLMPRDEDINGIVWQLIQKLNNEDDPSFKESLCAFKVKDKIDEPYNHLGDVMPTIVLYPASGKHNAQYVLDVIRGMFGDMPGTDVTPRYNQKVTSLIYFAQGDGDSKSEQQYANLYEGAERIYYAHNFTPSGANNGYHLKFEKSLKHIATNEEFKEQQRQWLAISMQEANVQIFKNVEIADTKIDEHDFVVINQKLKLEQEDKDNYSFTKKIVHPSAQANGVITFLCVHGTFSSAGKFTGDMNKENSQHLIEYAQRLAYTHNKAVEVIAFSWSSALDKVARHDAGNVLAHMLVEHMNPASEQIIVYAHSHGCNVVSLAAQEYFAKTQKMFDTAIYCASPTSDIIFDDITNGTYRIKNLYHFYGSADVTQALGSLHSQWNFDRKLTPSTATTVHNIRLMHGVNDLNHANIKNHVSKNMWKLMEIIDEHYPLHYDLDASVTDDEAKMYVGLRHHDVRHPDCDEATMEHAEMYSAQIRHQFKNNFDIELSTKGIYEQHPWTAFLYMMYGELKARQDGY